jgi:hypothetical protein
MSRYYRLVVTPITADGKEGSPVTWTNKSGNKALLNAQRIEFDLSVTAGATPAGGSWIRVWGPTREQISQPSDFNGATIELYGGMQKGLPLATQTVDNGQPGLLAKGTVFQAFSNYQGTIQTLEFVLIPAPENAAIDSTAARQNISIDVPPPPQNFSFTWRKGELLTDAVTNVLQGAYPGASITVSAADDLILLHDEYGVFTDIRTFSTFVLGISQDIKGSSYAGLIISASGAKSLLLFDNTKQLGTTTKITMLDLIGQVTWLSAATATFMTVLRADLNIGSVVTFPPLAEAQAITTNDSQSRARNKNTFRGKWQIGGSADNGFVRHVGDSRAPAATSWVSIFQAVALEAEGA